MTSCTVVSETTEHRVYTATDLDQARLIERTEAAYEIKAKIVEMLDYRKRGLLKPSGDDFLSGLVAAWEILTDRKWTSEPGSAV